MGARRRRCRKVQTRFARSRLEEGPGGLVSTRGIITCICAAPGRRARDAIAIRALLLASQAEAHRILLLWRSGLINLDSFVIVECAMLFYLIYSNGFSWLILVVALEFTVPIFQLLSIVSLLRDCYRKFS